jgi:hypothetical protein
MMKINGDKMKALRSIRSNIAIQMEKIDIEPSQEYVDLYKEQCEIHGIPYPTLSQHERIIEQPIFEKHVLCSASRRHRYALLKYAYKRINAKIEAVEQEAILDLIEEAKTELK